jgi:predicted dehydrogenase
MGRSESDAAAEMAQGHATDSRKRTDSADVSQRMTLYNQRQSVGHTPQLMDRTPMSQLGFGVVGTGMIAGVVADAIAKSTDARLIAVSSRQIETARNFVAKRVGVEAVQGVDALIARDDVDAVYIATPTAAKESIALPAITAGKHVLVEKPFADHASVQRMTMAAANQEVAFMDATHFVHHPRTSAIRAHIADKIGTPRSLSTTFYFPFSDRSNIRFDLKQEPMSAIGDMGWYSMRAVIEYLRPEGRVTSVSVVAERDAKTSAVVRASGLIAFEDGKASTFDFGYTAGTAVMDLRLLGTKGVIGMDDFVLDWTDSFAFKNPDIETGYIHWTGMATRSDVQFVPSPVASAQVLMIEHFARLASSNASQRSEYASASLKTQEYLDLVWKAANST